MRRQRPDRIGVAVGTYLAAGPFVGEHILAVWESEGAVDRGISPVEHDIDTPTPVRHEADVKIIVGERRGLSRGGDQAS